MTARSEDQEDKARFRTDRFFCQDGQWYFTTRENTIKGPYSSREDAQQELMMYLRDLRNMESFGIKK